MDTPDARTLAPEAQESLRHRTVAAVKVGMALAEAARTFGMSRQAIYGWLRAVEKGGSGARRARKRARPRESRLAGHQAATTVRLITDKCPDQLRFPLVLWTREAVGQLTRQRFGLDVSVWTVGRYLRRWGVTPQKPVRRAYERIPVTVKRWLEVDYPAIRKQAKQEKAEIDYGDEMGLHSDHQVGRSYRPRGKTPVIPGTGQRFGCNVISTITNRGIGVLRRMEGRMRWRSFLLAAVLAAYVCACTSTPSRRKESPPNFDEAWFVLLRADADGIYAWPVPRAGADAGAEGIDPKWRLFEEDGEPMARRIAGARRMSAAQDVFSLASDERNYSVATSDWEFLFGGFLFYRNRKLVLELVPNFAGNDMGARPAPGWTQQKPGMSAQAYDLLAGACLGQAALVSAGPDVEALPPPAVPRALPEARPPAPRQASGLTQLEAVVPEGFSGRLVDAESLAERQGLGSGLSQRRAAAFSAVFRETHPSDAEAYESALRVLGCLEMRWNCVYRPLQTAAMEVLENAENEALDRAIRQAAESPDSRIRKGAARFVFCSTDLRIYGKAIDKIEAWKVLHAKEAYGSAFAENRRRVLALLPQSDVDAVCSVLVSALRDPDRTVRRRAIARLGLSSWVGARDALEAMARGGLEPRTEVNSIDWSLGAQRQSWATMLEERFEDSDLDAAARALDAWRSRPAGR